jgi:YidC/Oxa1 family membrane protein insertase
MLRTCHVVVPNYGVCILILTLLVRGVTLPILSRQMRSTERMRELQPKLKEIQEEFQHDRARQSKATMALYREAGVNPMGGCLPMLLQMPIFIGLFYALRSSIELRHAPFALWITDLSAPETLFTVAGIGLPVRLLPLLMAGSMVLQQKVQPTPTAGPSQARMMQTVMPVMMTLLFYSFPSGLVLYYLTSNLLAVGHQLWVRHRLRAT